MHPPNGPFSAYSPKHLGEEFCELRMCRFPAVHIQEAAYCRVGGEAAQQSAEVETAFLAVRIVLPRVATS
jgi:hypothetical protein